MRGEAHVNLCFHGIGSPQRELEQDEARYWVPAALFEEVLDFVAGRPYVSLSFDDGNSSDVELALPALVRRGLRASFFPLAGRLGLPGSLGAADLRELATRGMTIGSHGWWHRPFRGLAEGDLHEELVDARREIALAAGVPVRTLALPLGRYDRRTLGALRRHCYARVFTSDRARATSRAWLQPRYSITAGDDLASVRRLVDEPPSARATAVNAARMAAKRLR